MKLFFSCTGCHSVFDVPEGYALGTWSEAHRRRCKLVPTKRGLLRRRTPKQKPQHQMPEWLRKVLQEP